MVRACSGMLTKFCGDVIAQGNTEGVLPCLVEHKNDHDMVEKCHASIEHWQLVRKQSYLTMIEFSSVNDRAVKALELYSGGPGFTPCPA